MNPSQQPEGPKNALRKVCEESAEPKKGESYRRGYSVGYKEGYADGFIAGKKEQKQLIKMELAEETKKFVQGFAYKPKKK